MSADLISLPNNEVEQGGRNDSRETVYEEVKLFVSSLSLIGIVLLVAALILLASEARGIDKPLALVPLIFMDSVCFYFKWYFLLFLCKTSVLLEILTLLFDLCTWGTILMSYSKVKASLLFTMIPIGLSIITTTTSYMKDSSALKVFLKVIYKQYKIILKWVGFLTVLFIGLKTENVIHISWGLALWPVWVGLLAMGAKSLIILGYLTGVIANSELLNTENLKISPILWFLFSTLGCALSCTMTIFLVIKEHHYLSYLPVIIFLVLFEFFTLLQFEKNVEFITDCFYTQDFILDPEVQSSGQNEFNESSENKKNASWKRHFRFIKRITSTYYKPYEESASVQIDKLDVSGHVKTKSCEIALATVEDEEQESWKVEKKCLICLELPPNTVITPCGHGGICSECASKISKTQRCCHICRGKIKKILKDLICK